MMHLSVAGEYTLKVRNAETGEVTREVGPFKNIITDIGLEQFGLGGATVDYCYVGSGNAAPSALDTAMQSRLATSNSNNLTAQTTASTSPYRCTYSLTFRFNQGVATGNLSEVGVGWSTTGVGSLFSRTLIVDALGNPVTITILPIEVLDVTYTLYYYPPLTDTTYTVEVNGVTHTITARTGEATLNTLRGGDAKLYVQNVTAYSGDTVSLGPVTGTLTGGVAIGGATGGGGATPLAYTPGSRQLESIATIASDTANDARGIKGLALRTQFFAMLLVHSQLTISPPIMKNNTQTLTMKFKISWGRY